MEDEAVRGGSGFGVAVYAALCIATWLVGLMWITEGLEPVIVALGSILLVGGFAVVFLPVAGALAVYRLCRALPVRPVIVPSVIVALPFGVLSSLLALWVLGEGLGHLRLG